MTTERQEPAPTGHTPDGGVLVGRVEARRRMVLFEDPRPAGQSEACSLG